MKKYLLLCLIFSLQVGNSQALEKKKLYKWVDKNGHVHYSDEPQKGAKEIQLKEVPTIKIKAPKLKDIIEANQTQDASKDAQYKQTVYKTLTLSSPEEKGVIRNNASQVTLTASVKPGLQDRHIIHFFLDGSLIKNEKNALSVTVENVDYGQHSANVIIVDPEGKQIQTSKIHHFHLLHTLKKK